MRNLDSIKRRLAALEAQTAAPRGPAPWPPFVQGWHDAHGWLPAGPCYCLALAELAPDAGPAVACGRCPRATDPAGSPVSRALPIAWYDGYAEGVSDAQLP